MEQHLKERLVGAVVLMAVAVVFVPMILSGPRREGPAPDAARPSPPAPAATRFSSRIVPLGEQELPATPPAPAPVPAPAPRAPSRPVADDTSPAPPTVPPRAAAPAPSPEPSPSARSAGWVVQLGSFSNPRNARALRDRLEAAGYRAFVESSGEGADAVTRVFVGPEAQREKAEKQVARLARETRLKGIVLRYPPD